MKKNYKLLAALLLLVNIASAQYYYLPFVGAGTNPGGVNNDNEYPVGGGLTTGWTSIHPGSAATPAWSTIATIPFTFSFNGAPVTQYKVSTSGVLTFTTGAVSVPAYGAIALPSSNVPDNSICVLGVRGTGANDNIVTKVFGSAPNRQLWVFFSSYSTAVLNAWTYWSIVLEETSNNVYIVDQRHSGSMNVSAGIQINSTNAISVFGSPALGATATTDFTPSDNSYYQFVQGTQAASQAKMKKVIVNPYIIVPGSTFVEGEVINLGANNITNMDIKYESNGTVYTSTLTGLNILSGATYQFIHNTPLNVSTAAPYPLKVWVDVVADADHTDDTLSTLVTGLAFQTTKRVLIEEGTGTWCGWCPRGAVYTEQIDTVHAGTAIVVAVHNADPMTNTAYDAGMNALISGYPSGAVDRKDVDVDPTDFGASYAERINDISPADVAVSAFFNSTNRQVDVVVSATFAAELTNEFRLSAILVEDDVTGTTAGYNQTNYYSFQSQNIPLVGAGHNWQTEPSSVPAASMVYEFVGREVLGGFDGQFGSIPATVTSNSTYSYTFTTTIPATWDENEMRVIGVLHDVSTGHILNVNRGAYGITTSIEPVVSDKFSMVLYPNPATDFAQLEINLVNSGNYSVEIFDMLGQVTFNQSYSALSGKNIINVPVSDLKAGVYMVKVNVGGSVLNSRLVVN
jgi:hypothetical protein